MDQKIMIDFENKRVWCFVCKDWVKAEDLFIDGTHDNKFAPQSRHTVWGDEL
jgi:hypothetical protein